MACVPIKIMKHKEVSNINILTSLDDALEDNISSANMTDGGSTPTIHGDQ
jgi:hypothetical protein